MGKVSFLSLSARNHGIILGSVTGLGGVIKSSQQAFG